MNKTAFSLFLVFALTTASFAAATPPAGTSTVTSSEDELASYLRAHPRWGVEISASNSGMGPAVSGTEQNRDVKLAAFSLEINYQPKLPRSVGVLGIGPTFVAYSPAKIANTENNLLFPYSLGAQIRYQGRWFEEQFLVPVASLGIEYWQYRLRNGDAGKFWARTPSVGAWLLLNALDSERGRRFFSEYGIARCYLTLEYRNPASDRPSFDLNGASYLVGLRVEY